MEDLKKQALTEHLRELRSCLIKSLLAVGLGFALCYNYAVAIASLLFRPLYQAMPQQAPLIFSAYQEGFFFI